MRARNVVGIYRCDTPSIDRIRTNLPSVSKVTMEFVSPLRGASNVHVRSFGCISTAPLRSVVALLRHNCSYGCYLVPFLVSIDQIIPF